MTSSIPIVAAYLLGGIPFGLIVPRLFGVTDIRKHGSGNIGATNVGRVVGVKAAVWVYAGDILKGAVPVLLARWWVGQYPPGWVSIDAFLLICALAAVLGHILPIYLGFRGGKGVNTALGGMIALLPVEAVIALVVFGLVVIITRMVSLGSMLAVIAFAGVIAIERFVLNHNIAMVYVWFSIAMAVLILITHRQNIRRLIEGTENKVTRKTNDNNGDTNG